MTRQGKHIAFDVIVILVAGLSLLAIWWQPRFMPYGFDPSAFVECGEIQGYSVLLIVGVVVSILVRNKKERKATPRLNPLIEIVVVLLAIIVLDSIMFPLAARIRQMGRRDTCLSQLRQLAQAIQLYAQDNDGHLPSDPWTTCTSSYLKNANKTFHCPSDASSGSLQTCSYGYNGSLLRLDGAGITESLVTAPSSVALICDAGPERPIGTDSYIPGAGLLAETTSSSLPVARHSKGINVSFCDGHAEYVPADFAPADCANKVTKGFYECLPLGLVDNPGGGLPAAAGCMGKSYHHPNRLVIGGEYATMPLLAEMAEIWKRQSPVRDIWNSENLYDKSYKSGPNPNADYQIAGFQGEYARSTALGNDYLWGTVDGTAGKPLAHDALVVIVAKNSQLPPNLAGGLASIRNSSTPANGWYCCNTATIAAWFDDGYAAGGWQAYTYAPAVATSGQLARYLRLPRFGAHCRVVANDREMVDRVANDPRGIGYCSSACVDYDRVQCLGIFDPSSPNGPPDGQYYWPNAHAKYRTWVPNPYPNRGPNAHIPYQWPPALVRSLHARAKGEGAKLLEDFATNQQLANGPLFACSYW